MKAGVILFHKNIFKVYKKPWIDKCLMSINDQTFQDFEVYELCYGDKQQLWPGSTYFHRPMINHIYAQNFLLDKAFESCDIVFNVNLDDYYDKRRFELQIEAVEKGYSLISSDFQIVRDIHSTDLEGEKMIMSNRNINKELIEGHNVIGHPVVCYTKKFWLKNRYYKPERIGDEDLIMWRKAMANKEKMYIVPQLLFYYRLHSKQIGRIGIQKKLSILILTIPERKEQFKELYENLQSQITDNHLEKNVEILYDNGKGSEGEKRNRLKKLAIAQYVVFIDDDDTVHERYVPLIIEKLFENPNTDCVTFNGRVIFERHEKEYNFGLQYKDYIFENGKFLRPPGHLTPIKKDISDNYEFGEFNDRGTDVQYAMRIVEDKVIKTAIHIDETLYFYDKTTNKRQADKSLRRVS